MQECAKMIQPEAPDVWYARALEACKRSDLYVAIIGELPPQNDPPFIMPNKDCEDYGVVIWLH